MPRGRAHGWGIAGEYLAREISALPPLEGVTLHCMRGNDLQPFEPEEWNRFNIGYCFFEDAISVLRHAREAGRRWDMIVTGSRWCEYQLRSAGVRNCATILQGVDSDIFYPGVKAGNHDSFVIFSGGKFEVRKGQDIVISAMREFMARHDDVLISCAWHNQWPFSMATMELSNVINYRHKDMDCSLMLRETLTDNGIPADRAILHPPLDNSMMRDIYLSSDIGLFPNRCEGGNNMVMCEYMACGRTVIASDMTGHNDIITVENAFPLTRYGIRHYRHAAEGFWFEPDVGEVLDLLEKAYHDRSALRKKGLRAVIDTVSRLSWSEAAKRFHAIGRNILKQGNRRAFPVPM